jgi:starch-binding outer membrane protein, SusD/RagB family
MVRARARGNTSNVLPEITTTNQGELRELIRHERRVELAMENERFFDLVRWGIAQQVLGPMGYQPRNQYLPIPQPEIDKSNGVLVQNPAY